VIGAERLAKGGAHGCALTSRDVIRGALLANASAIVLGHNHPSGNPTPSPEDLAMTRSIQTACDAVGLALVDHLVVCPEAKAWRSITYPY
jgi:DNA repair protein RadC